MNKYLPEVPVNVRGVIFGIEYPLRLTYVGYVAPNGHLWAARWPDGVEIPTWEQFDGIECDKLPAHTGVAVELAGEERTQ